MRKSSLMGGLVIAGLLSAGVAMAVEITPNSSDKAPFFGYATSAKGRIFRVTDPKDPVTARNAAKDQCEHVPGAGICNALSVGKGIRVVVETCNDGSRVNSFLGADREQTAEENAVDKAGKDGFDEDSCKRILQEVAGTK